MAYTNEAQVNADIKNNDFRYCYIVFGEDRFLKKRIVEKLSSSVADKDDFFNFQQFDNDSSLQEVYDAVQQYPMMSDKKCVILKDYDFEDCEKEDFERLLLLCGENIDTAVFILWYDYTELDFKKSDKFKKLCAAAGKNNGRAVEVNFKGVAELAKMLCDGAKKRGCSLSHTNAVFMVETVGTEIETLQNELEKVCAFVKQGEINEKAIKEVCIETVEQSVYKLSEEILRGNVGAAVKILDNLFFLRVKPMAIFYTVAGVYVDFGRAYATKKCGVPINEAFSDFSYAKNKTFLLERAIKQVAKLNKSGLQHSLDVLMETDRRLKSYSADEREILEEMIVRLAFIAKEGKSID